jgi:hypothetical protein
MKKLIFFVVIMLGLKLAYSQPGVRYTYDNSGNRISRFTTSAGAVPQWLTTGNTRCAVNSLGENIGLTEREERDNNPGSSTYNQTRWVMTGFNTTTCPVPPRWGYTGSVRCQVDASGTQNTGYEEYEQIDENPRSATYGQTQWILGEYNQGMCPLPCDYSNCDAYGPDYRCVYGSCEVGYKVYTYSEWDWDSGMYICYYHYEWSDGYYSPEYSEYNYNYCY